MVSVKKFLLASAFLLLFFPKTVNADLKTARLDYAFQTPTYQTALNNYQIAKSAYQTYKTLVSQNEAEKGLRQVVQARDQVIISYYNLLQERLNTTDGLSPQEKNTFRAVKDNQIAWLADHQKKIADASTLADLNAIAAQFEAHYPQFDRETKQAVGLILLTRVANLKSETDELVASFSAKLSEMQQDGEDTNFLNRGLITVRNKSDLEQQKSLEAQKIFYPQPETSDPIDLAAGRNKLTQAKQYLREAVTYLLELIKYVTG